MRRFITTLLVCLAANLSSLSASDPAKVPTPAAKPVVQPQVTYYGVGDVALLDGPFLESRQVAEKNLLALDVDRLLSPFLLAARLEPEKPGYHGWEGLNLPGVALSFYLSGLSRVYVATGKEEYGARLNHILDQLELCQSKTKGLVLGAYGARNIFKRLEKEGFYPELRWWGAGQSTPYYSMEKLMSGLRDAYRLTGDSRGLQIQVGLGNWLDQHMALIPDDQLQKIMQVEYGGMNWVLSDLYADTGDRRYLALSKRWHDNITVQPAIRGEDALPGKHANMQFPKISGLAARYPYSGEPGDLAGARFFWERVTRHHSYATGGNSDAEYFGPPDTTSTRLSVYTEENCNIYNMLRLSRQLFELEPKVEYADYMERALYNHILAAQNTATGEVCYFLPLLPGAERVYQPLEYFSCCTASGLDSYTRHAEYIYAGTETALFVNLFVPSEVDVQAKGLRVRQDTRFPDADTTRLAISCAAPVEHEVRIRHPYWLARPMTLTLNGQPLAVKPEADGYIHLKRIWQNGDVVQLTLPMQLRAESAPDDKSVVALFQGPVLLAAELSPAQGAKLLEHGDFPALTPEHRPVQEWLKPTAQPLVFTTAVLQPEAVNVMPLFRRKEGSYAVYWKVTDAAALAAVNRERAEHAAGLERRTLDRMVVADPASEKAHNLTIVGRAETGKGNQGIQKDMMWRFSDKALSYTLAVPESEPTTLFAKYMGRAQHERWNTRIAVDGQEIKLLKRPSIEPKPGPTYAWADTYAIPPELTRGKKTVTVSFETLDEGARMARIVELRTLKP